MTDLQAQEARRRRREFIRAHHPDGGGDPETFIAGLHAFDARNETDAEPLPEVVVIRQRAWPLRQGAALARRLRYGPRPPRVR